VTRRRNAGNLDVFAEAPGLGEHLAVVYAEPVNEKQPDGDWEKIETQLEADDYGWSAKDPDFAVSFPRELSAKAPVLFDAGERVLRCRGKGMSQGRRGTVANDREQGEERWVSTRFYHSS
jgi:hypothetical protein